MGKNKIEKLVEELRKLGENESYMLDLELGENYSSEIGYFVKNGRGKYAVRVKYGITNILKIRNSTEFEVIKAVIDYLDKKRELIEALDRLNGSEIKSNKNKSKVLRL